MDKGRDAVNHFGYLGHTDFVRELSLEQSLAFQRKQFKQSRMFKETSFEDLHPVDYLNSVKAHIPDEVISTQNFETIRNVAENLNGNLTSFFGFESRLLSPQAQSDFLVSVSSQKGERESLFKVLKNNNFSEHLRKQEWENVKNFSEQWSNQHSVLYDNILGLWLEFDIIDSNVAKIAPSVFLHTKPLNINKEKDIEECIWVTRKAIPILTGQDVSKDIENFFIKTLKQLPEEASVFQVAAMLSRKTQGIRLVIKGMEPEQIVPYLRSLGWNDKNYNFSQEINEIKRYVNCIRLHINIDNKIDQKIGLECFISPNMYHKSKGWKDFLTYLVERGLCLPEKQSALLRFPGIIKDDRTGIFSLNSYAPAVKLSSKTSSKAIVRYISHVKISYTPNEPIEAKAYTGVRLFGTSER